jgi:hypothetical protein
MIYFDCFAVGAWMFAIGWASGAVYVHNQNEKVETLRPVEKPEPRPDGEAWLLPVLAMPMPINTDEINGRDYN